MIEYLKKNLSWLAPIFLMIAIAPLTPWIDMELARSFYHNGHFSYSPFLKMVYDYGPIPGDIVIVLSLAALTCSYLFSCCKNLRSYALYLVLTVAIGAGIITHAILKDHWGRPRPKQVEEFGGQQQFRPFYKPNFFNQPEASKSFSCGHCSVGFCFFAFIFLGKQLRNKWIFVFGIVSSLFLGILLSYTRIAQGGHFFSDTLMTALIMWLTALALDKILFEKHS